MPGSDKRTELAIACANAAVQSGVRFILMLSVLTADVNTVTFGRQFGPIEAHVKQVLFATSFFVIFLNLFMALLFVAFLQLELSFSLPPSAVHLLCDHPSPYVL